MKPKCGVSLPMLAIAVLVAAGARQSTADPVEPKAPVATAGETDKAKQTHFIRLRNVPPRIVAWWLDPLHNPVPVEFEASMKSAELAAPGAQFNPYNSNAIDPNQYNKPRAAANPKSMKGAFELPKGVDQIIAVDLQNALLVYGTEEGVRRLQTLVAYLDRPLRQIEIEAHFVETNLADGKAFGIDWSDAGPFGTPVKGLAFEPGTFGLGYVRGNLQAGLKAMVAQGKAKIISSPRVTASNNLTASIYTSTSIPVVLGLKDDKGNFREFRDAANPFDAASRFSLTTQIGLTVTPTVNNDGTITLVMQPAPRVLLTVAGDKRHSLPLATQDVSTIANVRDGDTIALGGLSAKMMKAENLLVQDDKDDEAVKQGGNMILFVTARIIHRAEDTKAETPVKP